MSSHSPKKGGEQLPTLPLRMHPKDLQQLQLAADIAGYPLHDFARLVLHRYSSAVIAEVPVQAANAGRPGTGPSPTLVLGAYAMRNPTEMLHTWLGHRFLAANRPGRTSNGAPTANVSEISQL